MGHDAPPPRQCHDALPRYYHANLQPDPCQIVVYGRGDERDGGICEGESEARIKEHVRKRPSRLGLIGVVKEEERVR